MNFREELKSKIKKIRYLLEAIIVKFGLFIFYTMRPQLASNMAAALSKFIGKKIPVHKLAYRNLSKAMPNLSEDEKEKILDGMWDNLGRIVGEYPHISHSSKEDLMKIIEVPEKTLRNLEVMKANNGKGGVIFSGHIGNWEIGPKFFIQHGCDVHTVYRPLNNPYVEKMTASLRGVPMIEKTTQGNRKIVEVLKSGGFVMILADQKISEGVPVKFFHENAITTTSIARLALKYDVPLIPARSIRLGKDFRFAVEVCEPLLEVRSGDQNVDILKLTEEINRKLESWIREHPAQWFWVHDRWKK